MTANSVVRNSVAVADPSNPANAIAPQSDGSVPIAEGTLSALNVTASTVIKATPGRSYRVSVVHGGTGVGTLNDCAAAGDASSANTVGSLPTTVGTYLFNWPHAVGIVLVPGTGQTLAISYT